jgi:hypothetical protein
MGFFPAIGYSFVVSLQLSALSCQLLKQRAASVCGFRLVVFRKKLLAVSRQLSAFFLFSVKNYKSP